MVNLVFELGEFHKADSEKPNTVVPVSELEFEVNAGEVEGDKFSQAVEYLEAEVSHADLALVLASFYWMLVDSGVDVAKITSEFKQKDEELAQNREQRRRGGHATQAKFRQEKVKVFAWLVEHKDKTSIRVNKTTDELMAAGFNSVVEWDTLRKWVGEWKKRALAS